MRWFATGTLCFGLAACGGDTDSVPGGSVVNGIFQADASGSRVMETIPESEPLGTPSSELSPDSVMTQIDEEGLSGEMNIDAQASAASQNGVSGASISCDDTPIASREGGRADVMTCPNGGVIVEVGRDTNQNGVLDDDEVGEVETICQMEVSDVRPTACSETQSAKRVVGVCSCQLSSLWREPACSIQCSSSQAERCIVCDGRGRCDDVRGSPAPLLPHFENSSEFGARFARGLTPEEDQRVQDARDAGTLIDVDAYGAVGDGETDDWYTLRMAINAAGSGGVVRFTPGKTYAICNSLVLKPDQLWIGYGSTLKRCASPTTSLNRAASVGDTEIFVGEPELFRLNCPLESDAPCIGSVRLTPIRGPDFGDGEVNSPRVVEIRERSVVLEPALTQDYPVGAKVLRTFPLVGGNHRGRVLGLTFDGNWRENNHWLSWIGTVTMKIGDVTGMVVRDCTFVDLQDGITTLHSTELLVENNLFWGGAGSAMHFSGTTNSVFKNNTVVATNRAQARMVHSEGAITPSLQNDGMTIHGNCIEGAHAIALGEVSVTNVRSKASRNLSFGNEGFLIINSQPHPDRASHEILIDENMIVASDFLGTHDRSVPGSNWVGPNQPVPSKLLEGVTVVNNLFDDTKAFFFDLEDAVVRGNVWWNTSEKQAECPILHGRCEAEVDHTSTIIFENMNAPIFEGNMVLGGRTGITLTSDMSLNEIRQNNTFVGQSCATMEVSGTMATEHQLDTNSGIDIPSPPPPRILCPTFASELRTDLGLSVRRAGDTLEAIPPEGESGVLTLWRKAPGQSWESVEVRAHESGPEQWTISTALNHGVLYRLQWEPAVGWPLFSEIIRVGVAADGGP